jgi:hypothetical protein
LLESSHFVCLLFQAFLKWRGNVLRHLFFRAFGRDELKQAPEWYGHYKDNEGSDTHQDHLEVVMIEAIKVDQMHDA